MSKYMGKNMLQLLNWWTIRTLYHKLWCCGFTL